MKVTLIQMDIVWEAEAIPAAVEKLRPAPGAGRGGMRGPRGGNGGGGMKRPGGGGRGPGGMGGGMRGPGGAGASAEPPKELVEDANLRREEFASQSGKLKYCEFMEIGRAHV